jgi:hypothetical protein
MMGALTNMTLCTGIALTQDHTSGDEEKHT